MALLAGTINWNVFIAVIIVDQGQTIIDAIQAEK